MPKISQIEDALLAEHFHWPSDSQQVWRHLSDYSLVISLSVVTQFTSFCAFFSGVAVHLSQPCYFSPKKYLMT